MVLSAIQGLYEACKSVLLSTGQPVDEAPRMQGSGNHFWIYGKQLYMLFSRLEPNTSRLYGGIAPKLSFSPNGSLSEEALEKVRARLDKMKPSDVRLKQEAKLVWEWEVYMNGINKRQRHNGSYLYSPIEYLHLHGCESFSVIHDMYYLVS